MGNCIDSRKEEWEVKKDPPLEKQLWPEMRTLLDKTPKENNEEKDRPSTTTAGHVDEEPKSLNKLPRRLQARPACDRDSIVCAGMEGLALDNKSKEESEEWLSWPKNPILLDQKNGAKDDSQTIESSLPLGSNLNTAQTESPDKQQTSAHIKRDLPTEGGTQEEHINKDVGNNVDASYRHVPEERCGEGSKNWCKQLHDNKNNLTTTPSDNHTMAVCARNTSHPNLSSVIRDGKINLRSPGVATMANLANSNCESTARLEREEPKKNMHERQQKQGAQSGNIQRLRKKQAKKASKPLNPDIAHMALSMLAVSHREEISKHELSPTTSTRKGWGGTIATDNTTDQKMSRKYRRVSRQGSRGLEPPCGRRPPRRTSL